MVYLKSGTAYDTHMADNMSTSGTGHQPPLPNERSIAKPIRRREKTQLSCTLCRSKKLKCDRIQPCRSCVGRGLEHSCTYVHSGPSSQVRQMGLHDLPRGNTSNIQNKIDQLEGLVVSLMTALNGTKQAGLPQLAPAPSVSLNAAIGDVTAVRPASTGGTDDEQLAVSFGKMTVDDAATKYVDGVHWTAILEGISELKDELEESPKLRHGFDETQNSKIPCPQLLFGVNNHATKAEIVSAMPPRHIVDKLVSKFFNIFDIGAVIMHRKAFAREYAIFWTNPMNMHIMWCGMLYAMIFLAYEFQESQPESYSIPYYNNDTKAMYREKVVQCLVLGNYATCPPYTIQTLALYFVLEHFQYDDTEPGCWILQGIILRIAIRAGYHRDASHFPDLSPYQGEMRRRLWAKLVQLDLAISHQNGLPRMIRPAMSDTAEPRNLNDDDFYDGIKELPPSRPDTDITPMLRVVVKNRLGIVYSEIVDLTANIKHTPYKEIMRLDTLLHATREKMPDTFKWTSMRESVTDNSAIVMYRVFLDVYFHAARCTLHRSYCDIARTDSRYKYSRNICIESSIHLLEHQHLMQEEMGPGGQLHDCMWVQSSLTNHDFLVGTTILCLEINQMLVQGQVQADCAGEYDSPAGLERILQQMRKSLKVWTLLSGKSKEAGRGARALHVVLEKVEGRHQFCGSAQLNAGPDTQDLGSIQQPSPFFMSQDSSYLGTGTSTPYGEFQTDEELVDGLDWDLWDTQTYQDSLDVFGNTDFGSGLSDFEVTGRERDFML